MNRPSFQMVFVIMTMLLNAVTAHAEKTIADKPVELVLTASDRWLQIDEQTQWLGQPHKQSDQRFVVARETAKPVAVGCNVDTLQNVDSDALGKRLVGNCRFDLRY